MWFKKHANECQIFEHATDIEFSLWDHYHSPLTVVRFFSLFQQFISFFHSLHCFFSNMYTSCMSIEFHPRIIWIPNSLNELYILFSCVWLLFYEFRDYFSMKKKWIRRQRLIDVFCGFCFGFPYKTFLIYYQLYDTYI